MYLNRVIGDIQRESATSGKLNAEHLYKLNEAIFNLPDDDNVDSKLTKKIFSTVEKIRTSYRAGKVCDDDNNFFYDYVALLGTLQNQHFFSAKETDKMLSWAKETLEPSPCQGAKTNNEKQPGVSQVEARKIVALEKELARLKAEIESLREISSAVEVMNNFKALGEAPEAKAKSKSKSRGGKGKKKAAAEDKEEALFSKMAEIREKRKGLKKDGKSKEEADEAVAPLLDELKELKAMAKSSKRDDAEEE